MYKDLRIMLKELVKRRNSFKEKNQKLLQEGRSREYHINCNVLKEMTYNINKIKKLFRKEYDEEIILH